MSAPSKPGMICAQRKFEREGTLNLKKKISHANFGFGGFCEIVRVTVMHFIRSINYIN